MKTVKRLGFLLIIIVMILTTAPEVSETTALESNEAIAENSAKIKDTLIMAVRGDPPDWGPNSNNSQNFWALKKQIYETLVVFDKEGIVQPCLAESWEFADDLTLIFHLRKGVFFHNGEELKASDVLFSFKKISESKDASPGVANLDFEKTVAIDDYTVKVVTKQPFSTQIKYFEWPLTSISSEKAFNDSGGDYNADPLGAGGTGPYTIVEFVPGDRVVLAAFEDYWEKGKPYVKNLIIRIITESTTRGLELESGGVDIALELNAVDITGLRDQVDTDVVLDPSAQTNYLSFQNTHKYINDPLIRKAIVYAIDWDTAVSAAFGDTGIRAIGFLAPSVEGFASDIKIIQYDPEMAKKLLIDAGYPDGFEGIKMYTDTVTERRNLAEIMQSYLADVGIGLELVSMEQAAYVTAYKNGEHDLMLFGLTATTGEPGKPFAFFTIGNSYENVWGWGNQEFTDLVSQASVTLDDTARNNLWHKAQEMLNEDLPMYPVYYRSIASGIRTNVKGFENNPSFESPLLKNVYFGE